MLAEELGGELIAETAGAARSRGFALLPLVGRAPQAVAREYVRLSRRPRPGSHWVAQ